MSSPSISIATMASAPAPELISREERALVRAFALFTDAAASLEHSYAQLQAEGTLLRHELEKTNRDLALSLEQNRRIRQHLDRILEGLPCGVLVKEVTGQISIANPEARRLLGVSSGDLLAVMEQLPDWAVKILNETVSDGAEKEYSCGAAPVEWMAIRQAQLDPEDGGSSIFILRDSSEAKRLEQTQTALRRRQALAEMSVLLAHEIRNPLGSMELFAGLLAEAELSGEAQQWVAHLRTGLRTLAATVNNALHFHGEPPLELAPTDLGEMLQWLEEFLRPLALQANVKVELAHELDGVWISADRHGIEQVLLNLALNAFRFMPGEGALKITGGIRAEDRDVIWVEITDTGTGVAEDLFERIFEPGFTTRTGSPGLGLAVCKTIMQRHGGRIRVCNAEQGGACFVLEFPFAGESA